MDQFVLEVPKWQGELLFTKEILVFVGIILLLVVGILFCFWGYKYFKTVLFLGIGAVACYVSFLLIEPMTGNLVIRMFLTVSLTFLGVCLVYFLDIILGYVLDRLRLRNALGKRIYLFAAPLGAAVLGLTVYHCIWREPIVAVVLAVACGVVGLIFQYSQRKKTVRFKCYNDLLRIPRPKTDEDGLEYIAMELPVMPVPKSEPAAMSVSDPELKAASMPVPEPEPEAASMPVPEPEPEAASMFVTESEPEAASMSVPEPEPEAASMPVPESEPEAASMPVPESEPEAAAMLALESGLEPIEEGEAEIEEEPVEEIETEVEAGVESGQPEAIEAETEEELEPGQIEAEVEAEPWFNQIGEIEPGALSESIKDMLIERIERESEADILEEAPFVQQMNEYIKNRRQIKQIDIELAAMAAGRHAEAMTAAQHEAADVMNKAAEAMNKAADAMNKTTEAARHRRKPNRKQNNALAKAVAVTAAGFGLFIAGRASKGRD